MEETTMTLVELYEEMTKTASAYAKAYNEHEKKSALSAKKKAAVEAVNAYNEQVACNMYARWNKEGDPVRIAIRSACVPGCQKVKFSVDDDNYMSVIFSDDDNYPVNLYILSKVVGNDKFHDPEWFKKMEKLALLTAMRINEEITGKPSFALKVADATDTFSFPENCNPYSEDGVIYALQSVFDAICFIPDRDGENIIRTAVKSHDDGHMYSREWRVIRESMTRAYGRNGVAICNMHQFGVYVLNAMHGVLTRGNFTVTISGN